MPVDVVQIKLIPGKFLCEQQDWLPGMVLLVPPVSAQLWGGQKHHEN